MKPTALLAEMKRQRRKQRSGDHYRVRVGMATCGLSAGAGAVYDAFIEEVRHAGLDGVNVISTGCVGRCDLEPMAEVTRNNEPPVMYIRLDADKVRKIVDEHLAKGDIVEEFADPGS